MPNSPYAQPTTGRMPTREEARTAAEHIKGEAVRSFSTTSTEQFAYRLLMAFADGVLVMATAADPGKR